MSIKTSLDMKGWDKLYKQLEDLDEWEAEAGYYDDVMHESGLTMADLAWINNNGADLSNGTTIPARPFMDQSFMSIAGSDFGQKELGDVIMNNSSPKTQMDKLAKQMATQISMSIEYGSFEPNSPYTISLKGRDDPLIDSGDMKESPQDKVVKKGGD